MDIRMAVKDWTEEPIDSFGRSCKARNLLLLEEGTDVIAMRGGGSRSGCEGFEAEFSDLRDLNGQIYEQSSFAHDGNDE